MDIEQMPGEVTCDIGRLLPHGEGMRMIEQVVAVDGQHALVRATVSSSWPMADGRAVPALVLVEVAAQAAGIYIGWHAQAKPASGKSGAKGRLVGVKRARFARASIPLGAMLTIRAEARLAMDLYTEIAAAVTMADGTPLAEVHLQVLQAEQSPFSDIIDS